MLKYVAVDREEMIRGRGVVRHLLYRTDERDDSSCELGPRTGILFFDRDIMGLAKKFNLNPGSRK